MSKWQPEEEHLLRLLIATNSYNEIAEEFERRNLKTLPGFHLLRSCDAIRRKCSRDNITAEAVQDYKDIYKERWEHLKQINEDYKLEAEKVVKTKYKTAAVK